MTARWAACVTIVLGLTGCGQAQESMLPQESSMCPEIQALVRPPSGHPHSEHHSMGAPPESTTTTAKMSQSAWCSLESELALTRDGLAGYPTLGDAADAGFVNASPPGEPGSAHMVRWDRMDEVFDPSAPEQLLFESSKRDARLLAAVFYLVGPESDAPIGYAGGADIWHQHSGFCIAKGQMIPGDQASLPQYCSSLGGQIGQYDGWMLHAWVVPGRVNPDGIFAVDMPTP